MFVGLSEKGERYFIPFGVTEMSSNNEGDDS